MFFNFAIKASKDTIAHRVRVGSLRPVQCSGYHERHALFSVAVKATDFNERHA